MGLRQRREADERGFTLVEVLIGIVLLGGIVVGMMGTIFTVQTVSNQQRLQSLVQAEGRRFAEKVEGLSYYQCADAPGTDSQGQPTPGAYIEANDTDNTVTDVGEVKTVVSDIKYWYGGMTGGNYTFVEQDPNQPCGSDSAHTDCGLQQITVVASIPNTLYSVTIGPFLKRADANYAPTSTACQ